MLDQPFNEAHSILREIKNHGFQAYYVGGCVRDYLLNKKINDIDITTSALPKDIQKIFPKVIPVGIDHGTVIVRHKHVSYEVTSYKGDALNTYPSIEDDLKRRDFTMNALAMNESKEIIDLFHGAKDIEDKIIKTVGSPKDRFVEDPLRIIRALRFASQFGFDIEADTLSTMMELKDKISQIATERITGEIEKFLKGAFFKLGLAYLIQTDIYKELPVFKENHKLIKTLPKDIKAFNRFSELIAYFTLIDDTITINQWIKAWKLSNATKKEVLNLVASLKSYQIDGLNVLLLYHLDIDLIESFKLVGELYYKDLLKSDEILDKKQQLVIQSRNDLAINGNDLVKLFPHLKKGKWIEDLTQEIERQVLYKRIKNNKNAIKEWITCNRLEIN